MTFNITLPQLNSNTKSTKDKIISILSNKWPLSAKEIYNILQREQATEVSYQAVHKILNELQKEKILEKNGKSYQISKEWIQQVKRFGSELEEKYTNGKKIDFENFESMHLVFDSFIDYARFLINEYFVIFPNPERKDSVCFWQHVYPSTGVSNEEHENIKKFLAYANHYSVCPNNTIIDNFFTKYIESLGKKCINGVKSSVQNDTFIQGDFILEVFYPTGFMEEFDKLYRRTTVPDKIELAKFFEIVMGKKIQIDISINKNPSLADKLREEAIRIYEENKKNK